MNDFRFAFRTLLRNPTFTLAAILALALGIGATTRRPWKEQVSPFFPHHGRFSRSGGSMRKSKIDTSREAFL
jgi:hypothetical protein